MWSYWKKTAAVDVVVVGTRHLLLSTVRQRYHFQSRSEQRGECCCYCYCCCCCWHYCYYCCCVLRHSLCRKLMRKSWKSQYYLIQGLRHSGWCDEKMEKKTVDEMTVDAGCSDTLTDHLTVDTSNRVEMMWPEKRTEHAVIAQVVDDFHTLYCGYCSRCWYSCCCHWSHCYYLHSGCRYIDSDTLSGDRSCFYCSVDSGSLFWACCSWSGADWLDRKLHHSNHHSLGSVVFGAVVVGTVEPADVVETLEPAVVVGTRVEPVVACYYCC